MSHFQCSVVCSLQNGQTPVYSASRVATCSRLEVNPTSYSLTLQIGASPLYVASQEGHSDLVDILLKAGADVHQATTKV